MGVKLTSIIQRQQITFDYLKNKKVMIDAYNTFYQFLSSIRQPDGTPLMDSHGNITSLYQGIFARITNLMEKKILMY